MITFKQFKQILEAKKPYVSKAFPDSKRGAIEAFHHDADKRLHAKNPEDYIISTEREHTWVLSHPKIKKSFVVYTNSRKADLLDDRGDDHSDFEEIDHDRAMDFHSKKSRQ